MAHPYHQHREHQVAHRRVAISLKDHPPGAQRLNTGSAFSAVTSKSAASDHDADDGPSRSSPKRYARGGKVKHGHQTNIAIVVPHRGAQQPMAGAPPVMAGAPMPGGPPMAGPPPGPGAGNPPGMPQGMPMHKRGGRVGKAGGGSISGEATKGNIEKWSKRASGNSYFRGGAASGVGREEKAASQKKRK